MAASKNGTVLVLVVVILGALLAAGGWYWMTREPGAGDGNQSAGADAPLTGKLPASANAAATAPSGPSAAPAEPANLFTRAAVIEDANGYTNVRSGPSTVAPTVARVSAGEVFATYEQGGDWWRVRTEGGLIGYMPRTRIRLQDGPAPFMTAGAAAAPGTVTTADSGAASEATQPRRPPRPRSRIVRENSENMRLFCQNAGRGTPPCRRFRALGGR